MVPKQSQQIPSIYRQRIASQLYENHRARKSNFTTIPCFPRVAYLRLSVSGHWCISVVSSLPCSWWTFHWRLTSGPAVSPAVELPPCFHTFTWILQRSFLLLSSHVFFYIVAGRWRLSCFSFFFVAFNGGRKTTECCIPPPPTGKWTKWRSKVEIQIL